MIGHFEGAGELQGVGDGMVGTGAWVGVGREGAWSHGELSGELVGLGSDLPWLWL